MKKNISINLYGTIYQIDEDAYDLLERYFDSMKSYFSRKEGGEEIADDIEHRVAELLWDKREAGAEAVNIEMIKEIIGKIGDPEQIDNNDSTEASSETSNNSEITDDNILDSHPLADGSTSNSSSEEKPEFAENSSYDKGDNVFDRMKSNMKGRRLYRDVNDKVIGGVCSGMANYFGGDPTIWRLGVVIASFALWSMDMWWMPDFLGWIIPVGYIVLWAILPVVRTPEDSLRMRGEEVNPQNLNQEILNESDRQNQHQYQYQRAQHDNDGCLKIAGIGCLIILIFPLIMVLFAMLFAAPILSGLSSGLLGGVFGTSDVQGLLGATSGMLWSMVFCIVMFLAIPIFFIIRWLNGSKKPLSTTAIVLLIIVWLLSLGGGIYFFSTRVADVINNANAIEQFDDPIYDEDYSDDFYDTDTLSADTLVNDTTYEINGKDTIMTVNTQTKTTTTSSGAGVSISAPGIKMSAGPHGVKIKTNKYSHSH